MAVSLNRLYIFFFPFSFLAAPQHMELPSQGSDLNRSCDISRSCSNTGLLTHCSRPGSEPAFPHSQDATDPIAPRGNSYNLAIYTKTPALGRWLRKKGPAPHNFSPSFPRIKSPEQDTAMQDGGARLWTPLKLPMYLYGIRKTSICMSYGERKREEEERG